MARIYIITVRKRGENMSEEVKKLIKETVENLKHLDKSGIFLVKNGTDVLFAKKILDSESEGKENEIGGEKGDKI